MPHRAAIVSRLRHVASSTVPKTCVSRVRRVPETIFAPSDSQCPLEIRMREDGDNSAQSEQMFSALALVLHNFLEPKSIDPRQCFQKSNRSCQLLRDGNDAKDTRHACRSNTQGPSTSMFCSWPSGTAWNRDHVKGGLPGAACARIAGDSNLLSPSAAGGITCQQMAATSLRCASHYSHLSLSPSFRCLCIPRTLSLYILSPLSVSVAISGH